MEGLADGEEVCEDKRVVYFREGSIYLEHQPVKFTEIRAGILWAQHLLSANHSTELPLLRSKVPRYSHFLSVLLLNKSRQLYLIKMSSSNLCHYHQLLKFLFAGIITVCFYDLTRIQDHIGMRYVTRCHPTPSAQVLMCEWLVWNWWSNTEFYIIDYKQENIFYLKWTVLHSLKHFQCFVCSVI